jgi:hypothetical protein
MVSGSLEKRPIYSCRAHIATSFVLASIVIGREAFRGDYEIQGGRGIRSRTHEYQVSGLIILHRIRISFCGQWLYGRPYKGVLGGMGPTCASDSVIGVHMCAPVHQIDLHGGTVEGIKGAHVGRACLLNRRARVRACRLNRCAHVRAYRVNRRA